MQPEPARIVGEAGEPEENRGPQRIFLDADAPGDLTAGPDEQPIDVGRFLDVDIDYQSDDPGEVAVDVGDFIDADV